MRNVDAATIAALQNPDGLIVADLVTIRAKTPEGATAEFGFWSDSGNVAIQVYSPEGPVEQRNFTGSGALVSVGEVSLSHNLDVRQAPIALSQIHAEVQSMVRGHELRGAAVEIHRALFDVDTRLAAAPAHLHFIGEVDRLSLGTPAPGEDAEVLLNCVSDTRQLTRVNHARRGLAHSLQRSGDRFLTYAGQVASWELWWGEQPSRRQGTSSGGSGGGGGSRGFGPNVRNFR